MHQVNELSKSSMKLLNYNCNLQMLSNGPISSKSKLSQRNNQDGDLVSSKCIQTLDGQC